MFDIMMTFEPLTELAGVYRAPPGEGLHAHMRYACSQRTYIYIRTYVYSTTIIGTVAAHFYLASVVVMEGREVKLLCWLENSGNLSNLREQCHQYRAAMKVIYTALSYHLLYNDCLMIIYSLRLCSSCH